MFDDCNPKLRYFVSKACDNSWIIKSSKISFSDITFIISGSALYNVDGENVHVTAGNVIYIPEGHIRAATTEGMYCYAFNVNLDGEVPIIPQIMVWQNIDGMMDFLRQFEVFWRGTGNFDKLKCKAIFLDILHSLLSYENMKSENPYISQIKQFILEKYTQNITIKDIAKHLGLNEVYCGALFSNSEEMTIKEYINKLRVGKAIALIKYEGYNVSQAAYQSGFDNVSYFCRLFKKINGITPSKYKLM